MMRLAFSSVAAPEWVLGRLVDAAARHEYAGIELRTEGSGGVAFASDPALSDDRKVVRTLADGGVRLECLATGVRFDQPVRPPLVGWLFDQESMVRECRRAIELAASLACPLVRVFAFEHSDREPRARAKSRIVERLTLAADRARNTGVRLIVENGGSFPRAVDLLELLDAIASPFVAASYSAATAQASGEHPAAGVAALGSRLALARIKDHADGKPCIPGSGEVECREFVRALHDHGFAGPLVFEWDRAWLADAHPDMPDADEALGAFVRGVSPWMASPRAMARV